MNTISRRLLLLSTIPVVVLILVAAGITWHASMQLMRLDARKLARAIARQVTTDRSHYARSVVAKLEGTEHAAREGHSAESSHVPLSATFVIDVASDVSGAQDEYAYQLVSLWNANEANALAGPFVKRGFDNLVEQERRAKASGQLSAEKPYTDWQPYHEIETIDGVQHLRLVIADVAAARSCVSCHNAIEKRPEVVARRKTAGGIAVDKVFELNDLVGAIAVDVNLERAEVLASGTVASLVGWLAACGAVLAGITVYFGRRCAVAPACDRASGAADRAPEAVAAARATSEPATRDPSESDSDGGDWVELPETSEIGRASEGDLSAVKPVLPAEDGSPAQTPAEDDSPAH